MLARLVYTRDMNTEKRIKAGQVRKGSTIINSLGGRFEVTRTSRPRGTTYVVIELKGFQTLRLSRESFVTIIAA